MAKDPGFAKAFSDARKSMGAGKTFTYQGKTYSTNRADDKPAAAKPAAPTVANRPKPRAPGSPMAKMPAPAPARPPSSGIAGARMPPSLRTEAGRQSMVGGGRPAAPAPKKAAPVYDNSKNPNLLGKIGDFIRGGGMTGATNRKRAAAAATTRSRTVQGFSKGGYVGKGKKC